MALLYEQSSLTKAVKASYEERVAQLEQQLKEKARRLKLLARTESTALDEPAKIMCVISARGSLPADSGHIHSRMIYISRFCAISMHLPRPNQSRQEKPKKYRH